MHLFCLYLLGSSFCIPPLPIQIWSLLVFEFYCDCCWLGTVSHCVSFWYITYTVGRALNCELSVSLYQSHPADVLCRFLLLSRRRLLPWSCCKLPHAVCFTALMVWLIPKLIKKVVQTERLIRQVTHQPNQTLCPLAVCFFMESNNSHPLQLPRTFNSWRLITRVIATSSSPNRHHRLCAKSAKQDVRMRGCCSTWR